MPASRPGRTSPVIADIGMSAPTEYNTEFDLFDSSDDGSPLPGLNLEASPDTLQSLDTTGSGEGKGFLSPKASLAIPQSGGGLHSPSGSQDSTSDSSSSKRTQSSASTKTSFTAGDIVMTDGLDIKSEWKPEDFINADEDQTFTMFDGTIDPSSIENTFDFGDRPLDGQFDFNSASSSPSPFGITATDATSPPLPDFRNPHPKTSPLPGSTLPRGHNKAYSQYSLTQSMNGLNTSGSREVSPTSNLVTSQDSSPSALFNNSPSPGANYGLNSLPNAELSNAAAMWSSPQFGGHIQPGTVTAPPFGAMPAAGAVPQMPFAPQFFTPGSYSLRIHPTPLKSRVETQIPIKMTLSSLPPGIKRLHLPAHTISKPKLMVKPRPERCPDMLELHTALVCTSAMQNSEHRKRACERARTVAQSYAPDIQATEIPDDEESKPQNGAEVQICSGCVTRERKRAARKKLKKVEDEELWNRDENRRVIVFNTQEIKEWQLSNPGGMEPSAGPAEVHIDAPMRIACYCRHHGEKLGFQVIFTITDFRGQLVAQAMSSSIMITDDHKTHTLPPSLASSSLNSAEGSLMPTPQDGNSLSPGTSFRLSHSSSDLPALAHAQGGALSRAVSSGNPSQANSAIPTPRNLSRPASPTLISAPSSKKRKASGSAKVPSGLAMTRLETAHLPASQPSSGQMGSTVSTAVSPFSPNLPTFPLGPDPLFGQNAGPSGTMVQPFPAGPPTPNSNDHGLFTNANRSASLENLAMSQMYSAPASAHPSRAPSPNGLRNSAAAMQQQANFAQALANSLYTLPIGMNSATRPPVSVIHKIIPNEGPKSGGIEVTILGSGFYQGLEVMFGDIKATTTTFWGESSLVCLLPPSPSSGNVLVTFKQHTATTAQPFSTKPQPVFRYLDDDEQQLMRTALTVLAHKMNGNFEDVADVARRIIGDSNPGWGAGSSAPGNQRGGGAGFNSFAFTMNLETQLLKLLDLLDVDDSTRKARYNLRRSTGQTMLHLACSLGLHRFVAGLLARGAYCDLRDKGGYTPLHMASLNNHPEIVRRLIYAGADPTIRTLSGLTAADVARSREVIRAIRRMERHVRSRSGGSLHSRANSANSLRSLWDPLSPTQQSRRCSAESSEADEESPEYSSENAGSEEEDVDDGPWISARRRSSHEMRPQDNSPAPLLQPQGPDMAAGLASPTAAMSAFKEQFAAQFQQLQQAMALQLQNLPQFPYLPQMPNFSGMPPLPDYQAYLYSAPVIQRITSLVPNIGGSRPGSAGDQSPPKEMDGRWWDLSSLMASSAPPPAYDDIFPQSDLDRKQASAAQAAAEAEADSKCAGLYDVATASSATRSPALQDAHQLPDLLQIGRKNAITKEQQENLRRAHARKLKRLSRDRNLFFIWIPLLLVVLSAMLYSKFPGPFSALWGTVRPLFDNTWIAGPAHDRVVEVL